MEVDYQCFSLLSVVNDVSMLGHALYKCTYNTVLWGYLEVVKSCWDTKGELYVYFHAIYSSVVPLK